MQIKERAMNLNNTAVKPKNELEEKVAIAIYEAAGALRPDELYKFSCFNDNGVINLNYIFVSEFNRISFSVEVMDFKLITLDQLVWGSGVASDKDTHLVMCSDNEDTIEFCSNTVVDEDGCIDSTLKRYGSCYKIISTRPQQEETMKLQNGDYLPVSEIKTEQDFNDVFKAAENCGANQVTKRDYTDYLNEVEGRPNAVYLNGGGRVWLIDHSHGIACDNKLTLSQWLERGGIKQQYMPEVGEECYFRELDGCNGVFCVWSKCTILAYNESGDNTGLQIVLKDCGGDAAIIYERDKPEFKPLPTKEEEEREEFINNAITAVGCELENIPEVFGRMFDNGCRFSAELPKD